jgi:hypothetical protein
VTRRPPLPPLPPRFRFATARPWFVEGGVNGLILIRSRIEPVPEVGFTTHNGGVTPFIAEVNADLIVYAVNRVSEGWS